MKLFGKIVIISFRTVFIQQILFFMFQNLLFQIENLSILIFALFDFIAEKSTVSCSIKELLAIYLLITI